MLAQNSIARNPYCQRWAGYACWLIVLFSFISAVASADDTSLSKVAIRTQVEQFELPGTSGDKVTLPEQASVTVLCFLGTECPLARQYAPRLQQLADRWSERGVVFLGIDSNLQDSMQEVAEFRKNNNVRFPIGMDYDQKIAAAVGAERTPEVFVLDQRRVIRYRGRIDDQYLPGLTKQKATGSELADAIEAIVAGDVVRVERTQAVGCLIGRPKATTESATVTYCGQIARVFNTHCVECHRSGEIGPFAMTDYDQLRGWGDMIVEVIDDGRMPPWHAAPNHAALRNARSMPEEDKQLVRDWVAGGMAYGDNSQLPPVPESKSQWHLPRSPDLEVTMSADAYRIPAEGTVDYQYFVVDPGLTEDRWVSASQVIPGNPGVVHHAIVFIRPPDGVEFRGVSWLTAYVPGQRHSALPPGSARRIPAGSKLVFQMHYTPNGQIQYDTTKVGMLFVEPKSVEREVITLMAINQEFEIPPHAKDHPVSARLTRLPRGGELLAISPHMHVRGKSFQLFSHEKGRASPELLLDVPKYDFNWQHTYELAKPLPLDSIESFEVLSKFDNSTDNPVNPDPKARVTWGDQTWEEMAVAFFEVTQPLVRDAKTETTKSADELASSKAAAEKFADDFLARLDRNHDGRVRFDEAPLSIQRYSFWRFDTNRDNAIERTELIEVAPAVTGR